MVGSLLMIVALFGTTISPYLFFWQASQEVEDNRRRGDAAELRERVEFVHQRFEQAAIAEEFIEGRELYASVIGNDASSALSSEGCQRKAKRFSGSMVSITMTIGLPTCGACNEATWASACVC